MGFSKERGFEARAFYLNVLYLVLILLGALAASTLNAELFLDKEIDGAPIYVNDGNGTLVQNGTHPSITLLGGGEGTGDLRYRSCYITGTQAQYDNATTKGCIPIAEDQVATMDALNGISVVIIVFNTIVGIHSLIMHLKQVKKECFIVLHFRAQWVISLVNTALFVSIVALMNSEKNIQSKVNVANNLYYQTVNLFSVGVAGVVITVLDLIGSNMVVCVLCTKNKGYTCNPST